ncbi:MAG: helix-turn-helix domain-containing protein [Thermincola sp.]|jgi:DNA-binding HxlR family transcriptional regulator|nr:helix-turn-helix domain-containing protein [Thermincola sp.]MDT3703013.1 helix-turn-helix domain-containing protein [Thermincola sp.]
MVCPIEITVNLISSKWKTLILRDLMHGPQRFGELSRNIRGISQKMLTQQLREMEKDGLINRQTFPEVPPKVEYSLTEIGQSLKPILDAMHAWGELYKTKESS